MVEIKKVLLLDDIKARIPHRSPFLLIDRVDRISDGGDCIGYKTITDKEFWVKGHFPNNPVMPGVLIVETMAQCICASVFDVISKPHKKNLGFLASIEKVRFRKPILIGDKLLMKVSIVSHRANLWKLHGETFVNDSLACDATFSAMLSVD